MKKYLSPCIFCLLLLSCKSQTATITVYNRINTDIDSLYFPHLKKSYDFIVKPGDSKKITVDISGEKYIGDGGLYAYLYTQHKIYTVYFCRRMLFDEDDNKNYIYPTGTSGKDREPIQPAEFGLHILNFSGEKIDSIKSSALIKYNIRKSDSLISLELRFNDFSKKPEIYVYQNKKRYTITIDHPWDIWNYQSEMYNFYKDGVATKDSAYIIGKR